MYLFTGTSYGTTYPEVPTPGAYQQKTIFEAMQAAGVTWRYYYQDNSVFLASFNAWKDPAIQSNVRDISEYFKILADPNADALLPEVVFIERGSNTADNDEHPDAGKNLQVGAAAVANMINSLMSSKAWPTSVFIWSMDEPGGLYDHVPPQPMTPPDNQPPSLQSPDGGATQVIPGDFATTGMRVPFFIVSPFAKPHYVSHTVRDHTAILKFIEDRFGLKPLTFRDAAQPDMLEFFDFSNPAWLVPPKLPVQPVFQPVPPATTVCKEYLESQ